MFRTISYQILPLWSVRKKVDKGVSIATSKVENKNMQSALHIMFPVQLSYSKYTIQYYNQDSDAENFKLIIIRKPH